MHKRGVLLFQEDLDKRFGNEKRKMPKKKPAASTTTTTTAVAGEGPQAALLVGTAREKPSKKLTYVEYKKYLKGAAMRPHACSPYLVLCN